MAEDLVKNLDTYRIQYEQTEAALSSDKNNDQLKQLRTDLQEVIALTKNLLEDQTESTFAAIEEKEDLPVLSNKSHKWKVGDLCSAVWAKDGKWYNCIIDAITDDGMVAITFETYNQSDVTKVNLLKDRMPESSADSMSSVDSKSNKRKFEQNRQIAKKKKQKKFDRQKMIEEAHEADKAKWQAFNCKVNKGKAKFKGVTKKSIFATPEAANGRVGIGTCGIGGKPMTEFAHGEKIRKGN